MTMRGITKKAAGCGLVLVLFAGCCTPMASRAQLQMLEQTRRTAESAEADLEACKQRRAELERQLAEKKQVMTEWQNILGQCKQAMSQ